MLHEWETVSRTVFDKSKPNPHPSIADYGKLKRCKKCGLTESEVGYIIDGQDYAYGFASASLFCLGGNNG